MAGIPGVGLLAGGAVAALLLAGCASPPVDAQAALRGADRSMGAGAVKSLRYTAAGTGGTFA